jgi:hypothetical protein
VAEVAIVDGGVGDAGWGIVGAAAVLDATVGDVGVFEDIVAVVVGDGVKGAGDVEGADGVLEFARHITTYTTNPK